MLVEYWRYWKLIFPSDISGLVEAISEHGQLKEKQSALNNIQRCLDVMMVLKPAHLWNDCIAGYMTQSELVIVWQAMQVYIHLPLRQFQYTG